MFYQNYALQFFASNMQQFFELAIYKWHSFICHFQVNNLHVITASRLENALCVEASEDTYLFWQGLNSILILFKLS